ncbi:MAG: cytochrome c oxidase subunit II [Planctomycetes bacterium]|nr:cytochrome c oxidase subunit II [Planctomycetota bacterium]
MLGLLPYLPLIPQGDPNPKQPHTFPDARSVVGDGIGQMPPAASTFASDVDGLFYFCFWLSVFFFFLIAGLLVYTTIQNRRKHESQAAASSVTHNTALEVVWTLIPTIILMVIFAWGWKGNLEQSIAPGDARQYRATASQWSWAFQHPGQKDSTLNEFWCEVGVPVKFTMSSKDVLHSFFVPAFRAKRDVLPGRYQTVWFTPTVEGDYPLFCAEYCGKDHSQMISTVHVVSKERFDEKPWNKRPEKDEDWGAQFYSSLCIACHSIDGTPRVGPSFKGLWGKTEVLADGSTVTVDRNYVHESIRNPSAKIVKGFEGVVMTPYDESMIPEEGIDAICKYLETLKD